MKPAATIGVLLAACLFGRTLFALTDPARVLAGQCHGESVVLQGVISAAIPDSYDPNNLFLILQTPAGPVCLATGIENYPSNSVRRLIDAEVEIRGEAERFETWRNDTLTYVGVRDLRILAPAAADPFNSNGFRLDASLHRQKIEGRVIYASPRRILACDRPANRFTIHLAPENVRVPQAGQTILSAGFIRHGPFGICQTEAVLRIDDTVDLKPPQTYAVGIDELFIREARPRLTPDEHFNGRKIRIEGVLVRVGGDPAAPDFLSLDCGLARIPLDTSDLTPSALEPIAAGSRIEVTGICLFEFANDETQMPTPRFRGLTLIPCDAASVRLVARPPWWTPARLFTLLAVLAALLVGVLLWNVSLRVLVERRSRELARRQAETVRARLKTAERTRLASELHDSVVQNLTGAALEIRAARAALPSDAGASGERLDVALKTVNASRAELRNCIWDLRNQALEQTDAEEAIRITLRPHLGATRLLVRFNVARSLIPDSTFHSMLSIVRELAVNAIRHGGAAELRIAGTLDAGRLLFSVTDDGCGFDPATRPGMEEGHFGLEGVAERARSLDGSVRIDSRIGRGTRVSLDVALSREEQS